MSTELMNKGPNHSHDSPTGHLTEGSLFKMAHSHKPSTEESATVLRLTSHSLSLTWHQVVATEETLTTEGDTPSPCDIERGHGHAQQPPKRLFFRLPLPPVELSLPKLE